MGLSEKSCRALQAALARFVHRRSQLVVTSAWQDRLQEALHGLNGIFGSCRQLTPSQASMSSQEETWGVQAAQAADRPCKNYVSLYSAT